jgi:Zn-dependent peptidase ImmA (M78 family)
MVLLEKISLANGKIIILKKSVLSILFFHVAIFAAGYTAFTDTLLNPSSYRGIMAAYQWKVNNDRTTSTKNPIDMLVKYKIPCSAKSMYRVTKGSTNTSEQEKII